MNDKPRREDLDGCAEFDARLIDSVFAPSPDAELDRHLSQCERCRCARDRYLRTADALGAALSLGEAGTAGTKSWPRTRRLRHVAVAVAFIAAAALLLVWLFTGSEIAAFGIVPQTGAQLTRVGDSEARLDLGTATFMVARLEAVVETPVGVIRSEEAHFAVSVVREGGTKMSDNKALVTVTLAVMSGVAFWSLPGETLAVSAGETLSRSAMAAVSTLAPGPDAVVTAEPARAPVGEGSAALDGMVLAQDSAAPQPNVTVQLFSHEGETLTWLADTVSDENGWFLFEDLAEGSYTLKTKIEGDTPLVGEALVDDLGAEEVRAVSVEVERRYFISGVLLEEGTGQPVPGVLVTLHRRWGYRSQQDGYQDLGETGADGRFRSLEPAYPGDAFLVMRRGAIELIPDFMTGGLLLRRVAIGSEPLIDLVLNFPWTGVVQGRVIDPDGHPVAGALVVALNPNRNYFFGVGRDHRIVTTAHDGTFRMDRLPREQTLVLSVEAAGFGKATSAPFQAQPGEGAPEIAIQLKRFAHLTLRVVDFEGLPVAGAEVSVIEAAAGELEPPSDPTLTDEQRAGGKIISTTVGIGAGPGRGFGPKTGEDGSYAVDLSPGAYSILVAKDTLKADHITVKLIEGEPTSLTIEVTPRVTITGTVVNSSGEPVRYVWVKARALEGTGFARHLVQNESGEFILRDLRPGRYAISMNTIDTSSEPVEAIAPCEGLQLVWNPPPKIGLAIHVVDDATGKPVVDASVFAVFESESGRRIYVGSVEQPGWARVVLPLGTHEVIAGKRGYAVASSTMQVFADHTEPAHVELRLRPGHRVSGQLVDQNGLPVAGAQVAVIGAEWYPLLGTAVLTGADGSFTIDSLPAEGGRIGVISKKDAADALTDVVPDQEDVVLTIQR
ncbi:MAG: carboxypeptidase regulatory-like domain-containing protein [Planctomycetota bacterium]